jgi:hypothetical protein
VRRSVTAGLVALVLSLLASSARADGRCAPHPDQCIGYWTPVVFRLHAGLGAFLDGGAVSIGPVPDLSENARFSAQLQGEVGVRPFGGGTLLSLVLAGQAAQGAVVATAGFSLEYDISYLWDSDPDRDWFLAIGGALAIDYAHTATTSSAGTTWLYDLLRPDWRAYIEVRIRASRRERWLIRAQVVTGFDDLLDLASVTLCGGYAIDAF